LIVILLTKGSYEEAQYVIDEGLAREPDKSALIKLQARLFMAKNEQVAALLLLKRLKHVNADDTGYLSMLATLHQQQGEHAEALNLYRELLDGNPERSDWWVGQAISLEGLGRNSEALQAYLEARRMPEINARLKQYADERIRALN
jgi:Flp pilus assembly protein TadD